MPLTTPYKVGVQGKSQDPWLLDDLLSNAATLMTRIEIQKRSAFGTGY